MKLDRNIVEGLQIMCTVNVIEGDRRVHKRKHFVGSDLGDFEFCTFLFALAHLDA